MRFARYKKDVTKDKSVRLLVNLDSLEVYHPENDKRIKLVRDRRSYQEDGRWHVFPIAKTDHQVHIICPHCGEVHFHGNVGTGFWAPHCMLDRARHAEDYYLESEEEVSK